MPRYAQSPSARALKSTCQPVAQFKTRIRQADAILICTPEYNASIPGVLENAIDWASRTHGDSAWEGKPVAIMGASPGRFGTVRAPYHLRQSLLDLGMRALCDPEVMIANASDELDEQGNLVDQDTRVRVQRLLQALAAWTGQLQK